MSLAEIILIAIGLSLDIFAWVLCKSACFSRIDRRKMGALLGAFLCWELLALTTGYYSSHFMMYLGLFHDKRGLSWMEFLAVLIFAVLSLRMLRKAIVPERIVERREESLGFQAVLKDTLMILLVTYLAGVAFSACSTNFWIELLILVLVALAMVILGAFIGYHYGFGIRRKAYIVGFCALALADLEMVLRFMQ